MRTRILLLLTLAGLTGCGSKEDAQPAALVEVKVAKAEVMDVTRTVRGPAYLFGREQANVSARITAPIRALPVRKGDTVAAGDVLARLENRDLAAQLAEARAAATEAEANLQRVASGTLPTELERARGQVATSAAALAQAQKFLDRRRQLFEQGAIPQRDLLVSETELAQARSNHDVAVKALDLLQNQSRERDILIAKSKVEQAQARLALLNAQLEFAEIRSPFAGTVTEQYMFTGDMARPDAPIFTIADLSVGVARAQLAETEAASVRAGMACSFAPAGSGRERFNGRVTVVNQAVDPARRTVEVWCEIPNGSRALRAGAFGQVGIATGIEPLSVVVPLSAVQFVEGTRNGTVMVAGDKGVAMKKEIETGEVFDGKVQVKRGLAAGETVIVQGAYGLADGAQIRVQEDRKP